MAPSTAESSPPLYPDGTIRTLNAPMATAFGSDFSVLCAGPARSSTSRSNPGVAQGFAMKMDHTPGLLRS